MLTALVTPPVIMAHYLCVGGKTVEAGYPTPTTVLLVWQGSAYTLTQAQVASGARYTGFGLQWWSKGLTDATLSTLKAGEEAASDPGLACKAQLTPATPPAPGTPGALAADGTLIPEIATVGVTQRAVTAGEVSARVGKLPLATNPRAKMAGVTDGFVKLLSSPGTGVILGGVIARTLTFTGPVEAVAPPAVTVTRTAMAPEVVVLRLNAAPFPPGAGWLLTDHW